MKHYVQKFVLFDDYWSRKVRKKLECTFQDYNHDPPISLYCGLELVETFAFVTSLSRTEIQDRIFLEWASDYLTFNNALFRLLFNCLILTG